MVKSSGIYVHDCSMVSPLALIFFGKQVSWGHADLHVGQAEVIHVDNFIKFNCASGTGDLFQDLRRALDMYLDHKVWKFLRAHLVFAIVLTTHRLAYLCCQCFAGLDMKLAPNVEVTRSEREGILEPFLNMKVVRVTQMPRTLLTFRLMK